MLCRDRHERDEQHTHSLGPGAVPDALHQRRALQLQMGAHDLACQPCGWRQRRPGQAAPAAAAGLYAASAAGAPPVNS